MTPPLAEPPPSPPSLAFFGLVHTPLARERRSRCLVAGAGYGVVTGCTQMGSYVTGYDVELDSGRTLKVAPAHLRLVRVAP